MDLQLPVFRAALRLLQSRAPLQVGTSLFRSKAACQALALTPPNITMWLDRLEGRGLVERERSATDRRAQHLNVTAAGTDLVDRAAAALQQAEAEALAGLSAAENAMLVELLQKAARGRRKRAQRGD